MSTNLDRDGLSIVQYYRARYQMEFVCSGCETIYRSRALSGKEMRRSSIITSMHH